MLRKVKPLTSAIIAFAVYALACVALGWAEHIQWNSHKGVLLGTFTLMVSTAAALIAYGVVSEEVK